ncbi:MAG: hypothetical protein CVV27_08100 [Candidatus Melainabacteria bacterium HGW-Melainabacteria-1]|nr:MAG: hypothetical protein CVV27_08100 [Candidatus Melainabacteria bacterium HGW-Melainabacteria-1]
MHKRLLLTLTLLSSVALPATAQPVESAPSPEPSVEAAPDVVIESPTGPVEEPSEPTPLPTPEPAVDPENFCLELSCDDDFPLDFNLLFSLGYSRTDLTALNSSMQAKGYLPFSQDALSLGGSLQVVIHRVITEFEGNVALIAPSLNDNFTASLTTGSFLLNFGYQFRPVRNLSIYPLVGIGMGLMDLSFTRRNLQPSFDEFLDNPGRQGRIDNLTLALNAALGLDWRSDWGFQIGLRGGYLWSLPSNWWSLTDVYSDEDSNRSIPIAGGPSVSLSGPYLKVMMGF